MTAAHDPAEARLPRRSCPVGARRAPSTAGRAWSRAGCGPTRSSSTSSCTSRSSSSSCSRSTTPTAASTAWDGFSFKWFGVALGDSVVQKALLNSFIVAVPTADPGDRCSGRWPRSDSSGSARSRACSFDALTYTSIIVPEIVIALATLVLFATGFDVHPGRRSGSRSTSATRRSSRPTCCSTSAWSCCSSGRGCRAWTGRSWRPAPTCSRRRGGRSSRSPSRMLLPAIVAGLPAGVHVQLRRLRHHDVHVRSRLVDAAAVHLRPGQARRDAGDERRGHDDPGVHDRDAAVRARWCCRGRTDAAASRAATWPRWSPSSPASVAPRRGSDLAPTLVQGGHDRLGPTDAGLGLDRPLHGLDEALAVERRQRFEAASGLVVRSAGDRRAPPARSPAAVPPGRAPHRGSCPRPRPGRGTRSDRARSSPGRRRPRPCRASASRRIVPAT